MAAVPGIVITEGGDAAPPKRQVEVVGMHASDGVGAQVERGAAEYGAREVGYERGVARTK